MGKYAPLTRFLREQTASRITLRFADVEEILGFSLPESAYKYASWWANSVTSQAQIKSWRDAGWETRDVDLRGRKVTFVRVAGEPAAPVVRKQDTAARGQLHSETGRQAAQAAAHAPKALPVGVFDVSKMSPGMRRLLESRAARHGRTVAAEIAAIVEAALLQERQLLAQELAEMRQRTQRAGAFDLLEVLGRK